MSCFAVVLFPREIVGDFFWMKDRKVGPYFLQYQGCLQRAMIQNLAKTTRFCRILCMTLCTAEGKLPKEGLLPTTVASAPHTCYLNLSLE